MTGKHSSRPLGHARAPMSAIHQDPLRRWYGGAAVLVIVLLIVLSIGVVFGRTAGVGTPIIAEPRLPEYPAGGLSPIDPPPPTPDPKSPTTSPVRRSPAPRTTTTPPGTADLTARYIVYTSWDEGLVVGIEVTNHSRNARPWSVKVVHQRSDGVRVTEVWNAELEQGGATTNVFTGGDLAPGATLTLGFKATKSVTRAVRPTTCVVGRVACQVV